jgi:phosphoribosylaminoimidazole carboxylase PurE protein
MSDTARVGILMGSASDKEVMKHCAQILDDFGVGYEMRIASAHRTPDVVHEWTTGAEDRGLQVVICGAGMAAHLAGVVASLTPLPVIGVPLAGSAVQGMDSLLATVQMPGGVPVGTVAIGKAGAKNAAYLALRIMALSDPALATAVRDHRRAMAAAVRTADEQLQEELG